MNQREGDVYLNGDHGSGKKVTRGIQANSDKTYAFRKKNLGNKIKVEDN